jgi:hypothetical protein
MVEAIGILEEV